MKENSHTLAVHAGVDLKKHFGALSTPIYNASTFAFDDAQSGAMIHEGEVPGYFYSRINNPTQESLERALAEIEFGEAAIVFSSGMAAISNTILTLVKSRDHIVAPESVYASTSGFLMFLKSFGVEVSFVDGTNVEEYARAIQPNTKLLYLESPSNPTLKLIDIRAVTSLGKAHGLTTIMDNTFATPYNHNPILMGVDVVVHSLTKYIGGHADILAGAAIGSKDFIEQCRWNISKYFGGLPSPQTSWLAQRGIKTLAIRMEKHNQNAQAIATFLESHKKVKQVHYPGLPCHPQHQLAQQQMKGFGGMISFEVNRLKEGRDLVNALELCTLAVSLGDVSTIIQHSASMTHASVPPELRQKAGISDGLLRLSVGIEDAQDIINDLDQALSKI